MVSSCLSLFGTSTPALLSPSGSIGLPWSLSGLGEGKPIKGALFLSESVLLAVAQISFWKHSTVASLMFPKSLLHFESSLLSVGLTGECGRRAC